MGYFSNPDRYFRGSMSKQFLEIETKYNAADMTLTSFTEFCKSRKPDKFVQASGWDHFYASEADKQQFGRHRVGADFNQLTVKTKTAPKNNFIRQEDNLDFKEAISEERVKSFFAKFGYGHIKSIFKNCFIYKYPLYTLVYYVIYTVDMEEIGRYMEIEMSEDHPWHSAPAAWDALVRLERECKPLGVSAQGRIRKSLYEIVCE